MGKASTLPWSVIFPKIDMTPRHPSQIYEALSEGLLLFILLNFLIQRSGKKEGYVSSLFLIFYSIFRFLVEFTREPDEQLGLIFFDLSIGQLISLFVLFLGILLWRSKRHAV